MADVKDLERLFWKWTEKLRLTESWDVRLELVDDEAFRKMGDFHIDPDDRKAMLVLNIRNPRRENLEEVIVHELMHLKLYPLDQMTEGLINGHYEEGSAGYNTIYSQFMTSLEQTVEELAKCFLLEFGENRELSFGRCKGMISFDDLYDGLRSL